MDTMNIHEILKYLPHRYPLLLVDKVISYEVGKDIVALKMFPSMNHSFRGISRTIRSCRVS